MAVHFFAGKKFRGRTGIPGKLYALEGRTRKAALLLLPTPIFRPQAFQTSGPRTLFVGTCKIFDPVFCDACVQRIIRVRR